MVIVQSVFEENIILGKDIRMEIDRYRWEKRDIKNSCFSI